MRLGRDARRLDAKDCAVRLDFLDFVLELEDVVSEGFQLTFDEFQILTGPSLMTRVVCWSCESGRTSKWVQRCAKAARGHTACALLNVFRL